MTSRRGAAALLLALLVAAPAAARAGAAPLPGPVSSLGEVIPGRYIVVLEDGARLARVLRSHRSAVDLEIGHRYRYALKGYSAAMTRSAARLLARDPRVAWIEQDRAVRALAQTMPTGIDRVNADTSPSSSINGIDNRIDADVAVIDSGVDLDHPDLNVNKNGAKDCVGLLALSGPDDDYGHGSHVAGTLGAMDNNQGVVGVAPGVRIWPVKVLNFLGLGSVATTVCGIDYVTQHAAEIEVANMSIGSSGSDDGNCGNTNNDSEHKAICASVAAGVTYVAAAGNDSEDAAGMRPAAYDEVITVSSLADSDGKPGAFGDSTCTGDSDDSFSDTSNFGPDIDLIAPGVCIYSTFSGGSYARMSGTSMAAPHVAGAAALFFARNPAAGPGEVKAALQELGSLRWDNSDDGDKTKERLLDTSSL